MEKMTGKNEFFEELKDSMIQGAKDLREGNIRSTVVDIPDEKPSEFKEARVYDKKHYTNIDFSGYTFSIGSHRIAKQLTAQLNAARELEKEKRELLNLLGEHDTYEKEQQEEIERLKENLKQTIDAKNREIDSLWKELDALNKQPSPDEQVYLDADGEEVRVVQHGQYYTFDSPKYNLVPSFRLEEMLLLKNKLRLTPKKKTKRAGDMTLVELQKYFHDVDSIMHIDPETEITLKGGG